MRGVQVKDAPAQQDLPAPGRYRHFKGSEYELVSVARHSETEELFAVYFAVDDPERIWVRPVEMFVERIERGDRAQLRFEPATRPAKAGARWKVRQALSGWVGRFGRRSASDQRSAPLA